MRPTLPPFFLPTFFVACTIALSACARSAPDSSEFGTQSDASGGAQDASDDGTSGSDAAAADVGDTGAPSDTGSVDDTIGEDAGLDASTEDGDGGGDAGDGGGADDVVAPNDTDAGPLDTVDAGDGSDVAAVDTTSDADTTVDAGCSNSAACDDGNPCTEDWCDEKAVCQHAAKVGSCDDGDACTIDDKCVAGSCTAGYGALWKSAFAASGTDGKVKIATNGATVCATGAGQTLPWVQAVDMVAGGVAWKANLGSDKGKALDISAMSDKSYAITGTAALANGNTGILVARVSEAGQVLTTKTVSLGAAVYSGTAVQSDKFGQTASFAGFALDTSDATQRAVFFRYDFAQNKYSLAPLTFGKAGDERVALACNRRNEPVVTGHVLAGYSEKTNVQRAWLMVLSTTGGIIHDTTIGTPYTTRIHAIERGGMSGYLVGGFTEGAPGDGGGDLWVARTDAAGTIVWQRHWGSTAIDALSSLVGMDGDILVGGQVGNVQGNDGNAYIARLDPWGNVRWERTLVGTASDYDAALWWEGHVLLGGIEQSPGKLVIARGDAWGNASCAASGGCGAKGMQDCDDGNPCTTDDCASGPKCLHSPYAAGATCDDGKSCAVDAKSCSGT